MTSATTYLRVSAQMYSGLAELQFLQWAYGGARLRLKQELKVLPRFEMKMRRYPDDDIDF